MLMLPSLVVGLTVFAAFLLGLRAGIALGCRWERLRQRKRVR
jgi:hypothetical protein